MIYYILILLSSVLFTGQFVFTKFYEKENEQSVLSTLLMLAITSFVGASIFLSVKGLIINVSLTSFLWAILLAVIMIPYYIIGIKVLSLGSVAIYSMFMMLGGMLVPFIYGIVFLDEEISIASGIGTIIITIFIILQAVWQNPEKETASGKNVKFLFTCLCVLIFLINGMTGVIAKAHSTSTNAVDEASFSVIYCLITSILSMTLLFFALLKKRGKRRAFFEKALNRKTVLIMIALGITAYCGNFLQLSAADKVAASVQFPMISGSVIVMSAIASVVVFKEKISKKEWLAISAIFIATFLFMF